MDTKKLEALPNDGSIVDRKGRHVIVELVEYEHDSVVKRSILKKITGSIDAVAVAKGEGLEAKVSPFDTYIQIIEGSALIEVNGKETEMKTGDGMLIRAHSTSQTKPNGRFKMLITVVKSGYE
jgi:quercetin dioxygenase-like cupin family protein